MTNKVLGINQVFEVQTNYAAKITAHFDSDCRMSSQMITEMPELTNSIDIKSLCQNFKKDFFF